MMPTPAHSNSAPSNPLRIALRFANSSANWCGMALATAVLLAKGFGLIAAFWLPMALAGYVVGYQLGVLVFGKPQLHDQGLDALLLPADLSLDRSAIAERLQALMQLLERSQRFSVPQGRLLQGLCDKINALLLAMEQNPGLIALEDSYSVRRLALEYLPGLLHGYLSLPQQFASRQTLQDGQTAEAILLRNLQLLDEKVDQMNNDLASRDAAAFLAHSRFLQEKYGRQQQIVE